MSFLDEYEDKLAFTSGDAAQKVANKGTYLDRIEQTFDQGRSEPSDFQVAGSINSTVRQNPDQEAEFQRVAKDLNVSVDVVKQNKDDLTAFAKSRRLEMYTNSLENPVLRSRYADPAFAAVAHDQGRELSIIESSARHIGAFGYGATGTLFGKGIEGIGRGIDAAWRKSLNTVGQWILPEPMVGSKKDIDYNSLAPEGFKDGWVAAGKGIEKTAADLLKPEGPLSKSEQVAMGLGQAGGQIGLLFVPGAQPLAASLMFGQGVSASQEKIDLDKIALNAPQSDKDWELLTGGAITGATEFITSKFMIKVPQTFALRSKLLDYSAKIAVGATSETIQEVSENVLQDLAHIAFTNPEAKVQWDGAVESGEIGAWVGGIMTGVLNAAFHIRARGQVKAFENLNDAAKAQILRDRSPDQFQSFSDAVATHLANSTDGQVTDVYIDANTFKQVMSDNKVDITAVGNNIPSIGKQLADGSVDIVVPMNEWIGKVAGTEIGSMLTPHLRATGESLSLSELQDAVKLQGDLQKQADEAMKRKEADDEFKKSAKEVENTMFQQIKSTGRYTDQVARVQAQMVRNFYVTQAADMNMLPMQLYNEQQYRVTAQGKAVLSQQSLEQAAAAVSQSPAFRQFFGNSVLRTSTGDPMTVYHGTADDVTEFDLNNPNRKDSGWLGTGVYLTDSVDMADLYSGQKKRTGAAAPNVMPLYAKLENPYMATAEDKARVRAGGRAAADAFTAELQAQGYDGVIFEAAPDAREIVVFDPASVKSVFNEGTWSTETRNILKQAAKEAPSTPSDEVNNEADEEADDVADIVQNDIPTTVDDAAALDAALNVSKSQVWNKGRDLKEAIQNAVKAAADAAGVDVSAPSEQTTEYLVRVGLRDALFALEQNPNAIGWYDEKTRQALAVMALIHPEIATNENSRFAFTWALAVTSNGMKVDKNFELAEAAYEYYKQNKVMPTNLQAGQAQGAINKSLELFNDLVQEWGIDNLRMFMQTNFTVGEISSIHKSLKPGGEHADTKVKGAAIIGPKIGNGFFSNLYGDFSSLTMDRWLIRTWGRWTGTLIKVQPQHIAKATTRLTEAVTNAGKQAQTLSDIVGVDITSANIEQLATAVQKASMDPALRDRMNKTPGGEELRKAGNSLAKYLDGQKEAPAGPHERTYIRSVFNQVLAELQADPAYAELTMADLQAVLWYAEKRLYETAKDDSVDEESTEGYSDEDAPDYANAAAAVARGKGVSDRRINNALKKESKDERARRARLQDEQAQELDGEPTQAGGFTPRQKRFFAGAVATRIARSNRSGSQQQQWAYAPTSGGDSRGVRVLKKLGVTYTNEWKAGKGLARVYRANGIATPRFVELEQGNTENATRFIEAITASKQASGPMGEAVYVYPMEDYTGMRLFLSEDGSSGVAVKPDGDIVSVFSSGGAGRAVMELAVAAGGTKLDAFETILPEFYAAHGFVATSRLSWDGDQAPPNWDKDAFAEFNGGEPDVVFMAYDPTYNGWHRKTDGKKAKDYDDAVAEQGRAVKRAKKRKDQNGQPSTIFNQSGTGAGSVQRLRAGDFFVASRYGTPIDGASSVVGIHYSRNPRTSLAGNFYGTGLKGAEAGRLQGEPELSSRVHFYVDTGAGIRPESGVGGYVHAVNLDNLYDVSADPLGIYAQASAGVPRDETNRWFNEVERAVVEAGFDGIYMPTAQGEQGVAVLLGTKHRGVPVEQFGTHSMPAAGAYVPPPTGRMSYPLLSAEIRKFSEQEQAIKTAAPSARLSSGTLLFDAADAAAIEKFFPGAAKAQELRQEERGGFNPEQLTTILYEKADYSTFLHETAHFFLTVYADLAAQPNATDRQRQDMQTILDWFGIKDLATWNAMSLEEQRKYHEQFAYNYELYLFEGKAPSLKMQSMFDKFTRWLRKVYESIRDELNGIYFKEHGTDLPILTGEVKQVMDRMLASQEQIEQAESVRNMAPMYQTQEQSGMDDDTWAAYQEMVAEAQDMASQQLTEATLRQMKWLGNARSRVIKEMQKAHAEQRKRVRAEVEKEVRNDPLYRAMRWLKTGETTDEGGTEIKAQAGFKLSLEAVKAMYPESKAGLNTAPDFKRLGYGQYGMLAEEGLHPDIVAGMFGFRSGDELVRSLLDARKMNDEIEARTDQRMLEEFDDLSDPQAMEVAVERALHNEARARFVAVELRHLAKATQPVRVMMQAAKMAAVQAMNGKVLGEIKPRDYATAEARAAKAAETAMKKGDSMAAIQAKQQQLLNNQLAAEAIRAKDEVAKALDFFTKVFASDKRLAPNRDMNMVSAARAILANYGFGNTELGVSGYLEKVKSYDPDFYAEIEPMITAQMMGAKPFQKLTMDEFRDMRDQVQSLWHLSKRTKQVEIDGKMMDRDAIVGELVDRMNQMSTGKARAGYDKAMSDWDKRKIMLMGARAALRRVESWVSAMDGGKIDGPFRKYIWNPISESVAKYRLQKIDYLQKYLDIVKSVEKGLTAGSIDAREIGYSFKNKAELLHALLHTGNESNKRKLLLGREWAMELPDGTLDTGRWDRFIDRMHAEGILTKADWDFAQQVWDLLNSMKAQAQKAHYEMYGFYFNEVTANPVQTPFGTYAGGYVPAVTDPWIVTDAAIRAEEETKASDNSYMFPTTGRGFTKGRTEYNKPLILDLGFLPSHIDKVLRFSIVEPRIKDVAKIVKTNKKFAEAIDALDPTLRGDMLVPWLQRTAQQMIQAPMKGFGGKLAHKFFSEVRTRTGMQLMVANVTNALQQITGLSIAAVKVKPRYLRDALWTYTRQPTDTANMIAEKSEFMKTRMSSTQFEVQKSIEEMLVNPSKYDKLRDFANKHGYFMQQGMQNVVDSMVWVGAYNQEMEISGDEKTAVRAADAAVRETQGSFAPEDVSRFETGNAFIRAFTMFYSYFNMQANLLGTEFANTVREFGVKKGMGRLLYVYTFGFMIPAVLAEMIVQAAGGFDDGDDDEWDQYDAMSLFFGSQARTALAMVPILGPTTLAAFNAWNDKPYDDRISTSPSVSALETAARSPVSVYKAIAEDGSWKKAVRDTLTTLGLITGLPLGQLGKPLGYAADVAQGKAQPESAMDVARGVISGKDVNK